jgi:phosphoglycolate phosphatase-like HAD superfamily hydrolase
MHVCLFDIDGTLLASGGAGKAAMLAALQAEFGVADVVDEVPFSGRTDRAIGRDLFQRHGIEDGPLSWQRFLEGYLRLLPGCLSHNQGRVLPGIAALLEHLRQDDNIVVGLLTGNVRDGARLKLSHYGLYERFVLGGFGDHHLDRDDVARDALAAVHQHLDSAARLDQLWVIGDTPLDIRCARAIGAQVAAVATGWHSLEELTAAEPDLVVADWADPGPLLRQLHKSRSKPESHADANALGPEFGLIEGEHRAHGSSG